MTPPKRVLLLVGSPRGGKSNSGAIGKYLLERFAEHDLETDTRRIGAGLPSEETLAGLYEAMTDADLTILLTPLYVDSQPTPVVRFMEYVAERRRGREDEARPRFAVIVNCGLPETYQNDLVLRIYRCFATESGLDWAGGAALGMGETIESRPLERVGRPAEGLRKSLRQIAEALADGQPIPEQAVALMAKPMMPRWLYKFMAHRYFKKQVKRRATDPIDARPYPQ